MDGSRLGVSSRGRTAIGRRRVTGGRFGSADGECGSAAGRDWIFVGRCAAPSKRSACHAGTTNSHGIARFGRGAWAGLRGRIGVRRRWRRDDADACGVTGGVTGARRLMCVAEWSRSPFPGKGEARPCGGAERSGDRLLGHRFGKTRLASDDGRRADGGSRAGCLFRARRDRSARHASLSGRARPHLASDEPRILQAQMRLAFDNLNACLSAAGSTFDDVVDVTIVVVDPPSISTRSGRSRPATGATRRIRRRPASA